VPNSTDQICRRDRLRPGAFTKQAIVGAAILGCLVVGGCKPKTDAGTPSAATSAAMPASAAEAPSETPIDYALNGTPDPSLDPTIAAKSSKQNLARFRNLELHPPGDTREVGIEEQKEMNRQQRLRFYVVAKAAPELLTAQDWQFGRFEEDWMLSTACDDQDALPDGSPDRNPALTEAVCKDATARFNAENTAIQAIVHPGANVPSTAPAAQ
jgi:hypothetical protein